MARSRKCTVDGVEYSYCPRCAQYAALPKWMFAYCSENCKKISDTLNKYEFNHISKEEARTILEDCDLSNSDNFSKYISKLLNEVMDKASKINEEPVVDVVSDPEPVVDSAETSETETTEESTSAPLSFVKKKKKKSTSTNTNDQVTE